MTMKLDAEMVSSESDPGEVPLISIRPTRGFAALNLAESWHFRDLLWTLAARDIKLRYKQTMLGIVWVILQPLVAAGITSFIFGKVARLPSDEVPYFIFAFAGQLGWNLFSGILGRVSGCMVGNSHLISKVYFPRLILPLSIVPTSLLDFAVALSMLVVMAVLNWHHLNVGWSLLFFPLWMAVLIMLALGIGLWAAALNVRYRDVGYVLPVALGLLTLACPVSYAVSAVRQQVSPEYFWIYYLNPLSATLEGFRWSLLGKTTQPPLWAAGYAALMAVIMLVAGASVFKRMERQFADAI